MAPSGDAEGAAAANASLSRRCLVLIERSRLANLLAGQALKPPEPPPFAGSSAAACELSRQAVYWALCAHREVARSTDEPEGAHAPPTPTELWLATDANLLERAAGNPADAATMRAVFSDESFVAFAERSAGQQTELAGRLSTFAERLLEPLALPQRAQERAWARRIQILLGVCVLLVGLVYGIDHWRKANDLKSDMAPSASWTTSSRYTPECACTSPDQQCDSCPNFFFHTDGENQPWILFDLHQVRTLSAVVVENRVDYGQERAVPLVVEVSTDKKNWHAVAKRGEEFKIWRSDFSRVDARWVKLSVPRRTYLHLKRVRLIP